MYVVFRGDLEVSAARRRQERLPVDPGAVVQDVDQNPVGLGPRLQLDCAAGRLSPSGALGRSFDPVHHGVAHQVSQRFGRELG